MKKLYLYTNNHFSAKSVANAAMIKQQLGEPIEGEYPPEFIAALSRALGSSRSMSTSTVLSRYIVSSFADHVVRALSVAGTSSPATTWPKTAYLPFRSGRSASVT